MVLFICVVILVIVLFYFKHSKTFWEYSEKERKEKEEAIAFMEEEFQKRYEENQFNVSKEIEVEHTEYVVTKFVVDDNSKRFGFISCNARRKTSGLKCYEYNKLINFNIYEDGKQQISGGGLAAASGALMFGETGAIIGAATASREIGTKCMELSVKIQINDLQNPLITIMLLKNCEKSENPSSEYQKGKKIADELGAILSYIAVNK